MWFFINFYIDKSGSLRSFILSCRTLIGTCCEHNPTTEWWLLFFPRRKKKDSTHFVSAIVAIIVGAARENTWFSLHFEARLVATIYYFFCIFLFLTKSKFVVLACVNVEEYLHAAQNWRGARQPQFHIEPNNIISDRSLCHTSKLRVQGACWAKCYWTELLDKEIRQQLC